MKEMDILRHFTLTWGATEEEGHLALYSIPSPRSQRAKANALARLSGSVANLNQRPTAPFRVIQGGAQHRELARQIRRAAKRLGVHPASRALQLLQVLNQMAPKPEHNPAKMPPPVPGGFRLPGPKRTNTLGTDASFVNEISDLKTRTSEFYLGVGYWQQAYENFTTTDNPAIYDWTKSQKFAPGLATVPIPFGATVPAGDPFAPPSRAPRPVRAPRQNIRNIEILADPVPALAFNVANSRKPPYRERKARFGGMAFAVMRGLADIMGDAAELVDILFEASNGPTLLDAFPDGTKITWREKFSYLFEHGGFETVDWQTLLDVIVENQLEDFVIGSVGNAAGVGSRELGLTLGAGTGPAM